MNETQLHRGADTGFRNKPENISRECENITRMRYGWTLDNNPIGHTPSRKHWTLHPSLKRKFLNVNYRFDKNGRKIEVI